MKSLNFWVPIRTLPEMFTIQAIAFNEGFEWCSRKEGYLIFNSKSIVFLDGITIMHNAAKDSNRECTYLKGIQLLLTDIAERNKRLSLQDQSMRYEYG